MLNPKTAPDSKEKSTMKIVSFAALALISVALISSEAAPVANGLVRKRSQVNRLSGQQKGEENYTDHDVRHQLAETVVATEVVDGTVARMVEASTSMSSSLSMSGRRSRSLMSMSMPARCSFCAGGMPDSDLVLPTDGGATCGMAQAYASTLAVSDSHCQVALMAESICCPALNTAATSTPKSYAPTPEPASYAPTPKPASYAPTPEPASYAPTQEAASYGTTLEPTTDAPAPAAAPTTEVGSADCTCSDGVTVPFPFYGDPTICYERIERYDWCDFEYETMYCCRVVVVEENNGRVPPAASSAVAVISAMAAVLAIYFFCKRTSGNRSDNPETIEEGGIPTVMATKVDNPTDEAPFLQVNQVQVEWSPPPPSAPQLNPNECHPPPPSAPPLEYSASRCG